MAHVLVDLSPRPQELNKSSAMETWRAQGLGFRVLGFWGFGFRV